MEQDNPNVGEMLDILSDEVKSQVDSGDLVVLYESNKEDADGVLMAHNEEGGQRPMLVRQIVDRDFTPNPDWIMFLMTREKWEVAVGKDTILWTSIFGQEQIDDNDA